MNPPVEPESLGAYTRTLGRLVTAPLLSQVALEAATRAMDGEAGAVVRRLYTLDLRRSRGAFFTPSDLARVLVKPHANAIRAGARILDPACGAADLLLAAADYIPDRGAATWRRQLRGFDIDSDLIALASQRLRLKFRLSAPNARTSTATATGTLQCADFFEVPARLVRAADLILLNPPYSMTLAPGDWPHGEGTVTNAALFLSKTIERAREGTYISAILPDVLRSGSRYDRWRTAIATSCEISEVRTIGQFDRWTDVDVFMLRLRVGAVSVAREWPTPQTNPNSVSAHFDVTVGSVVPHRHADDGPTHPYIHARSLSGKRVLTKVIERRGFRGTVVAPPFVAIRRTSRPGDRSRCLATLVVGDTPIAVENHIICAQPKNGTRKKCEELLKLLQHPATISWLDERIRCRHLTVKAIREIAWIAGE